MRINVTISLHSRAAILVVLYVDRRSPLMLGLVSRSTADLTKRFRFKHDRILND